MIEPATIATERAPVDLLELEERVQYAEVAVSTYCSEFLAAREAERAARQSAIDSACRLGRARRELAEAREALSRARCSTPGITSDFRGEL